MSKKKISINDEYYPLSKKGKKQYWKDFRKRKRKLLKYIRHNYCEFGGGNLVEINIIYIQNLYEYHSKGLNVWQDDESHDVMMKSLTEAYNLSLKLQQADDTGLDDYPEYLDNLTKFFTLIGENIDSWWD